MRIAPGGVITRRIARSPLALLAPKNHGCAAWVIVGSLGGGLLAGDRFELELEVEAGASAYLGTQASTKIYPGGLAAQALHAKVGAEGLLIALPDPVVCFAGARYAQEARVQLGPSASLVWLESLSAGRVAHGERWAFERYASRLVVERHDAPPLHDAQVLDSNHGPLRARLGRFEALATLIAVGPLVAAIRAAWLAPLPFGRSLRLAVSPLGSDGVLLRLAAASVQELLAGVRELARPIVDLLGDDPFRT